MDRLELEMDQHIDPEGLDVACINQPMLFIKWAERAIEARGEVDRAKLRLETFQAELELRIRKNPSKYKLDKPTEAGIKAALALDPENIERTEEYFRVRDDAALLDKAVVAMEIRKRMLETLVTLHGQSYFAGPSAPRNLKEAYLRQQQAATERVRKKQIKIARKRGG